jgi:hypothetical protein
MVNLEIYFPQNMAIFVMIFFSQKSIPYTYGFSQGPSFFFGFLSRQYAKISQKKRKKALSF